MPSAGDATRRMATASLPVSRRSGACGAGSSDTQSNVPWEQGDMRARPILPRGYKTINAMIKARTIGPKISAVRKEQRERNQQDDRQHVPPDHRRNKARIKVTLAKVNLP